MDIEKIFKTRENALYYDIKTYKRDCYSWIGGNAPKCFDNKDLFHNRRYYFYLTLQSPLNPNKQFSIFTPDFDTALEYNSYPGCKVILIEHEISEQSEEVTYKHPDFHDVFSIYSIGEEKDSHQKNCIIKFGGNIIPIQPGMGRDEEVTANGYNFIFQINENPMGDISAFMSGGVFVYGQIVDNEIVNPFVAFWEYS